APGKRIDGQVVSFYGEALSAGQNQIVSINKGASDGIERGHVLALWSNGRLITDRTDPTRPTIKLPDERTGLLFVFRVFDRMSYAVILSVQDPVRIGDRFTEPER
ncbi:MAG: peptidoglycan-binding protein, partial [Aquabacterium sp.]